MFYIDIKDSRTEQPGPKILTCSYLARQAVRACEKEARPVRFGSRNPVRFADFGLPEDVFPLLSVFA